MSQSILIPSPLRYYTGQAERVEVQGATVGEILMQLTIRFPRLGPRLFGEQGELRRYVNVYVDGENIRVLEQLQTKVDARSEIALVPAIAGG